MLNSQKNNIRKIIVRDCGSEVRLQAVNIQKAILYLASAYTSAQFNTPLTQQQLEVVNECCAIVIDDFSMLAIEEIRLAFKMAASRKLKDVSLKAYFGKFHGDMMGEVLSAYLKYRNNVIHTYDAQTAFELKMQEDARKEEKNQLAQQQIKKEYSELRGRYNKEHFDLESELKASWAKVLVDMGIINFSLEEKREILKEAKLYVQNKLKAELLNKKNDFIQLQSIKHTLRNVANNNKDTGFEAKVLARYSKLLILKSIVNG